VKILDSLKDLWNSVYNNLAENLSNAVMNAWINELIPLSFENADCLVLEVSNGFKKDVIEKRFYQNIKKACADVLGFEINIELVIKDEATEDQSETGSSGFETKRNVPTFGNFVEGSTNQFAFVAAKAVAENPGMIHNPLFIYGDSGLGKTHLLRSIHFEIERKFPNKKIIFTSGENFLNEILDHISQKKMTDFHDKYRHADVLLMDDIQFIGRTDVAQEEFFHTFEAIVGGGGQIVLTSDRPPKDIPTLTERIKGRLIQGLLADIQPPLLETRIAIIKKKAEELDMIIPDDVVGYIAERLKNNVRQIESVVNKLYAIYSIENKVPTIGQANVIIKDIIYYAQPTEVTINNIIDKVASSFGVSPDDIRSNKKKAEISNARQFAMYIMREVTDLTYEEIGNQFGGKKHSTVIYSIESSESKMEDNPQLKTTVYDIMKSIKNEKND